MSPGWGAARPHRLMVYALRQAREPRACVLRWLSDRWSERTNHGSTLVKVSRFWLLALLVLSSLVLCRLALFAKPRQLSDCDYDRPGLWDLCKRGSGLYFKIPRELSDQELLVVQKAGKVIARLK